MKVLIDIPDKAYRRISEKSEVLYSEMIILNGTPLTDLTNGEIIQKMFPKAEVKINGFIVDVIFEMFEFHVEESWWNAKWGEAE